MKTSYDASQVMHRIRVKLYPNYLPEGNGTFFARTDSEANLDIEQVCAALRERGGFKGSYRDLVENIKYYNDEVAYQLCDGFAVNNGYFTIYPNLGGTFSTPNERPDPNKHRLNFRFRVNSPLRSLAGKINVIVDGLANTDGFIDEFIHHEGSMEQTNVNSWFIPGEPFTLRGHKIKIEGDDPDSGLFFVDAADPSMAVKLRVFIENNPSGIRGLIPDTGSMARCRVEVRTLHSGTTGRRLKTTRVIPSSFILERG